ncbi:hypothetical protein C5167_024552 [Papaver somniferum]|uniref:Uncharacterized protein n=1 Tax=Papaver somniferum TaxID=3469 RepID=A0A4Y7JSU5_PAPSO|nr:hypothetical protein C5167_024552 [Papaver somniferum]
MAIGWSLGHAGSSSISENLFYGHCQILMPMILDQGINTRNEGAPFARDAVAKAMRIVMDEPTGQKLREKALQIAKAFSLTKGMIYKNPFLHYPNC